MIRLAVAGMAHQHVLYVFNELPHQPEVRLVAASEPDAELRARYADRTAGVPVYTDHRELLAQHDVDVVAVNGVYSERAGVVVDALHAGAQVIADKPLCTSLEQLESIETAAAETGCMVSVMFEKRGYPVTLAARRLVDDGVLGDLAMIASTGPHTMRMATRPPWFFTADYGGILGDLAVHDVDMVLALTGAVEGTVAGAAGKSSTYPEHPQFSDHGSMLLVAGDVTVTIDAHWLSPEAPASNGRYQMRLVGTRGTAEMRWTEGQLEVATHDRDLWYEPLPPGRRPAEQFFAAMLTGDELEVRTVESVNATRVALLAQRSAERGGVPEAWKL